MKRILSGLVFCLLTIHIVAHPAGCAGISAGPDQTVCRHAVVALSAHGGPGVWTSLSVNPDTIVFANANDSNSTATGFDGNGVDTLVWTANGCSDTMLVKISGGPERSAGCVILPGGSATMAALGTGLWTIPGGNPGTSKIVDSILPNTVIDSFRVPGTYYYVWTTATCADTVPVVVIPKPNAGPDQTICRYSIATLAAHGSGFQEWIADPNNPDTIIFTNPYDSSTTAHGFNGTGVDTLIWVANGCSDTMLVRIAPNGGTQKSVLCAVLPGGSATMAATGTGVWSALAGNPGTSAITTVSSPTTTITTYSAAGTYYYIWTTNTCKDTVPVVVTARPNAGTDQTICQYNTTVLAATGSGAWTAAPGNPDLVVFANPTSPTTAAGNFATAGTYTLYWSFDGCTDTMLVHVTARPNGGPNPTTCQYSTAQMAAVGTGTWSALATNPSPTVIDSPSSATTVISGFSVASTYKFLWTIGLCADTVDVIVTPRPNGGPNQTICRNATATMAGVGTGAWTQVANNPTVAAITTPASPNTTITNFDSTGTYRFVWNVNGCADTVSVFVMTAGPDTIIYCYNSDTAHLHALGSGVWSANAGNPGASVILNPDSANALITGFSDSGTYTYTWTIPGGCTQTATVTAKHSCPPSNDNITNPKALPTLNPITTSIISFSGGFCGSSNVVSINGTNVGATPSSPYPYQGACLVNAYSYPNDVWYSFVPSGYTTIINLTGATGTLTNPMIDVWQGTPGNLSGLGCVTGSGGAASLTLYNLAIGSTYYIQVAGENANQNGAFTLTVKDSIDCQGCFHEGIITPTPSPVNNSFLPDRQSNFVLMSPIMYSTMIIGFTACSPPLARDGTKVP